MPQVRKLTDEEVYALQNKGEGQRKLVEEQYDGILNDYTDGDYGEATLDVGENRLTVRNRRTSGDMLRFRVLQLGNGQRERDGNGRVPAAITEPASVVVAPATPVAPAKRKGGRPRKNP
jgi:hypothetical protein